MGKDKTQKVRIGLSASIACLFLLLAAAGFAFSAWQLKAIYKNDQSSGAIIEVEQGDAEKALDKVIANELVTQNQLNNYQSSLSLILAVFGGFVTLFSLAMPLMQWLFVGKDQIESNVKKMQDANDEATKAVDEAKKVAEEAKKAVENADAKTKNIDAVTANFDSALEKYKLEMDTKFNRINEIVSNTTLTQEEIREKLQAYQQKLADTEKMATGTKERMNEMIRRSAVRDETREEAPVQTLFDKSLYQSGTLVPFGKRYKWRTLKVEETRALLITEEVIDEKPYNTEFAPVTWAESTLRTYLNTRFLNDSSLFTEEDRRRILPVTNQNPNNPTYGTPGGDETRDSIFLLSLEEVAAYFGDSKENLRKVTRGDWGFSDANDENRQAKYGDNFHWWWLRSPGDDPDRAAFVDSGGAVLLYGNDVLYSSGGVRPALWLNLES
ncbi:MAG: DUF6273 domain-containing protein [Oscillospiraceae bacterium]|jgi:hypothetical protein|nr:DUF6273 domain-containing protein [Oscillospiraceae bacterium]